MRAFIIAIGQELTTGQSVDTNSAWLSRELSARGIVTAGHLTVPDDQAVIARAFLEASELAEIVIATGGLGPTADDLTRQALADAMGVELVRDDQCLAEIEAFFKSRNYPMVQANLIQAYFPAGSTALSNSCGTAPGIAAKLGQADVYVTPGVPSEMKAMFNASVAPALPSCGITIVNRIVRLFGLGESSAGEILADLMKREGPILVGTTVSEGIISIRIISQAATPAEANSQADDTVLQVCNRLGEKVFGVGEDVTMASATGELLRRAGQTVATAESCTGGLIGKMLTDTGGSSAYYLGGIISYANEVKRDQVGVPEDFLIKHGAVSEQVAGALAEGARKKLNADWAIGVTGIAGPTGGTAEKPVGLVYTSLAGPDGNVTVQKNLFHGGREMIRLRSALTALNNLRLELTRNG